MGLNGGHVMIAIGVMLALYFGIRLLRGRIGARVVSVDRLDRFLAVVETLDANVSHEPLSWHRGRRDLAAAIRAECKIWQAGGG